MTSLYYLAALESALKKKTYVVAGTSNKCEEYVGYFTKGGDNVCDIKTIADFTVEQVLAIGEELGVPHNILYKTPSDGLSGKSDEDKLGVTYKAITNYMEGKEVYLYVLYHFASEDGHAGQSCRQRYRSAGTSGLH